MTYVSSVLRNNAVPFVRDSQIMLGQGVMIIQLSIRTTLFYLKNFFKTVFQQGDVLSTQAVKMN